MASHSYSHHHNDDATEAFTEDDPSVVEDDLSGDDGFPSDDNHKEV